VRGGGEKEGVMVKFVGGGGEKTPRHLWVCLRGKEGYKRKRRGSLELVGAIGQKRKGCQSKVPSCGPGPGGRVRKRGNLSEQTTVLQAGGKLENQEMPVGGRSQISNKRRKKAQRTGK